MLSHQTQDNEKPERVVIIGASGFVGGAIADVCEKNNIAVLRLASSDVDLLSDGASDKLRKLIRPGDHVVAAAARAPVKNPDMLIENLRMADTIIKAISAVGDEIAHVINISSDAIYADEPTPLNEQTSKAPTSMHGVMHLAREILFMEALRVPLCMLRPTLIYGISDPHNGYGPNRFWRQAIAGQDIVLFGEGEERRDHVSVSDVANLAFNVLQRRSTGAVNAASGQVISFHDLATLVCKTAKNGISIKGSPRTGPMPHNGYRPFDITVCREAFPNLVMTPPEVGVREMVLEGVDQGTDRAGRNG
jgi:UDP-glucose 4-epimerase